MNTATAARFGATNDATGPRRAASTARAARATAAADASIDVMGVRSTSSILCVSPSVSDVAGREPRRTGPKLRSINATIFGHAGVTGRPSEWAGPPVSTARLPILLCALANPADRSADRSTGTNRPDSAITACPTGPVANFTNSHACFLRGLLAAMASPVVPIFEWAACPFGPVGSTVMSKSRSVGPHRASDIANARRAPSRPGPRRTGPSGHRLRLRRGGRNLVLVGQIGVELNALDERVVVEIEVRRIHPRIRPRDSVVHPEQHGRVIRDPGVDESPLTDPARSVAFGERLGGVEEFAETPRLVPSPGRWAHAGLGEQLLVVEQEVSGPLLRECILPTVKVNVSYSDATLSALSSAANVLSWASMVLRSSSTPRSASPA